MQERRANDEAGAFVPQRVASEPAGPERDAGRAPIRRVPSEHALGGSR